MLGSSVTAAEGASVVRFRQGLPSNGDDRSGFSETLELAGGLISAPKTLQSNVGVAYAYRRGWLKTKAAPRV